MSLLADDEALQALEGRIAALENALAGKTQGRVAELTDDEVAAFKKVRDVIAADYGDFCGINDCYRCRLCTVCSVCQICRVCRVCIFECSCGPCNIGGGAASATSAASTSSAADIPPPSPRLQLAATARTHRLGDDTAVVDDHARLRLEGGFATFFDTHLRPLLTGDLTADQISDHFPDLNSTQLCSWLSRLVDAGVVQEVPVIINGEARFAGPGEAFYRSLGLDQRADDQLRTLRIGIVGYNRCGRAIARQLTDAGVNALIIVDPPHRPPRQSPA